MTDKKLVTDLECGSGLPPVTQADRIEAAVTVLLEEALCRARADMVLEYLDAVERNGRVNGADMTWTIRSILSGERDMRTISSGQKGPRFF